MAVDGKNNQYGQQWRGNGCHDKQRLNSSATNEQPKGNRQKKDAQKPVGYKISTLTVMVTALGHIDQ